MKRVVMAAAVVGLAALVAGDLLAQRRGSEEGGRKRRGDRARGGQPGGRERGPGGPGGRGLNRRPKPGEILPAFLREQLQLTAAQKTELEALQKEVSGKLAKILTAAQNAKLKEMGERGPGGRFGGGGRPGARAGGGRQGGGRPGGGRPGGGRPGGDGAAGGPGAAGGTSIAQRLMTFDKNKDKKLSKDELPELFQRVFERADTNKDEFLDESELKNLSTSFGGRNAGGPRGRFGGGRPGERGGRPKGRKQRPDME